MNECVVCLHLIRLQVVFYSQEGYMHEGYSVAIPIGVTFVIGKPFSQLYTQLNLALPPSSGASTSATFPVSAPFPTTFSLQSLIQQGTLFQGTLQTQGGSIYFDFTVPPGVVPGGGLVRLFGEDYPPNTDLDLFLYKKGQNEEYELVGESGTTEATEVVIFTEPGEYQVEVNAFALVQQEPAQVRLYQWAITAANSMPDGFTVSPTTLVLSAAEPCCCKSDVTATATGLDAVDANGEPARSVGYSGVHDACLWTTILDCTTLRSARHVTARLSVLRWLKGVPLCPASSLSLSQCVTVCHVTERCTTLTAL